MNASKLYLVLSQVAGLVGIGMMLGANLSGGTSNTPYWIGGILIFGAAVLLGMFISSRSAKPTIPEERL